MFFTKLGIGRKLRVLETVNFLIFLKETREKWMLSLAWLLEIYGVISKLNSIFQGDDDASLL